MAGQKKKREQCAPTTPHTTEPPNPSSSACETVEGKGVGNSHPVTVPSASSVPTQAPAPAPRACVTEGLADEVDFIDQSTRGTRVRLHEEHLREIIEQDSPDERDAMLKCGPTLDKSNFKRLFLHRHCCVMGEHGQNRQIVDLLEYIAAKMEFVRTDGEPGFFAKWRGWDETACLLAFSEWAKADSYVKCAIHAPDGNPGFCNQRTVCPMCVWQFFLRAYVEAFAPETGAFAKADYLFISISWTDSTAKRRRAVYRDLDEEDFRKENPHSGLYRPVYSPRPFVADDGNDVEELRALAELQLTAITYLYSKHRPRLLTGYRAKNELAIQIAEFNRFLPNLHAIGTTKNPGKHIAEAAFDYLRKILARLQRRTIVRAGLQPDVLVLRIGTADDLIRVMKYVEKPVDILTAWRRALNLAGAYDPDGKLQRAYVETMRTSVFQLFEEMANAVPKPVSRAAGTMRFGKACLGKEPKWHAETREKGAEKARKRRERINAETKRDFNDPATQKKMAQRGIRRKKTPPPELLEEG
jgi:hypothetical protein